jgi:hypothetical protein
VKITCHHQRETCLHENKKDNGLPDSKLRRNGGAKEKAQPAPAPMGEPRGVA